MLKLPIMAIPIFLASFFNFFGSGRELTPFEKNEKLMSNVLKIPAKELSKRYGLSIMGFGGAEKDGKSLREYIAFRIERKVSKEEARILIVEITEMFLHCINNAPEVKHFLYNDPFTYKNLEFTVFIYDKDGSDIFHPDLGLVSLTQEGTVNFVTYAPGAQLSYATDIEEPYEEAYQIAAQKPYPG